MWNDFIGQSGREESEAGGAGRLGIVPGYRRYQHGLLRLTINGVKGV